MLVIDMKKFMLSFATLLLLLPIVYSADITSCKSGSVNWFCERGKLCTCSISGTCTNGNILVYEDYVTDILCLPKISDKTAIIDWSYCNTTSDSVKIRVDCDEGQSTEKMIIVSGVAMTATTTTRTSTTVQTTISEGVCGADGYCEITSNECVVGYEDCNSYNTECNSGEKCCCPSLTTTIPEKEGGFNYLWIVPVIVVVIAAVLFYFFFLTEREKKTKLAFKRLYEKWIR